MRLAAIILLWCSLLTAAPVFVGTTTSYISNSADGGTWTIVISNQVVATWGANKLITFNGNAAFTNILRSIATNGAAFTNMLVDLNQAYEVWDMTNNFAITNLVNVETNKAKPILRFIRPQLINRTVTYPAFQTPNFGVLLYTNANAQPWTTLTGGISYVLSLTMLGSNGLLTITEWK